MWINLPTNSALMIHRNSAQSIVVADLPTVTSDGESLPTTDLGDDDYAFTAAFRDGSQIVRTVKRGELQYIVGSGNPPDYRRIVWTMDAEESVVFPGFIETPFAVERRTPDGQRVLVSHGVIRAISHPTADVAA